MNSLIQRRNFCKTAALTAAALASGRRTIANAVKKEKPNIIFIMADDLGYGDLGCYGQKKIKTPCLDAMAAEGMRFTQHYSGSTVCAPSRCSLMTGLHTGHTYIRGNREIQPEGQHPIPTDTLTVAKLLKKAGVQNRLYWQMGAGRPIFDRRS